jgi:RNA polymerase sigma factor (TIGR02999 family)
MNPAELLPQVYDELRKLAAAKMRGEADGHTLDATALVHEAWLKLNGNSFASKTDFIKAAAVAMRRILVDHARAKKAAKRGGGRRVEMNTDVPAAASDADGVEALDEALTRLEAEHQSGLWRLHRPGLLRRQVLPGLGRQL